jgi:hypothetical protein
MMATEWTDALAEQCERLLSLAQESREREYEIAASWACRKVAGLVQAGYQITMSPRLQAALRPFVTEE